jgi:hypothetical protein
MWFDTRVENINIMLRYKDERSDRGVTQGHGAKKPRAVLPLLRQLGNNRAASSVFLALEEMAWFCETKATIYSGINDLRNADLPLGRLQWI